MKKLLTAIALSGLTTMAMAETQAVTVIVSDASNMTQGMAMVLANQMQAQGAQVDILLCDQAGALALKEAGGEALKPNDVTPAQLLNAAMQKVPLRRSVRSICPTPVIPRRNSRRVSQSPSLTPWQAPCLKSSARYSAFNQA